MATLLLGTVGGLVGGALFGPVGTLLGRAAGALGGAVIDRALFAPSRHVEGPRLSDLSVMSSTEGAPMPRLYGRARLAGQVIWATPFEEVVSTRTQSSGGKGGGLSGGSVRTTTYSYFASFAVGLCEGEITRIGRIWADGQLLDTQGLTVRAHLGRAGQEPDPLIEAVEGDQGTPAYRGLAYVVFERLPLADYGNRLPQIAVEVERAVGALEKRIRAVTMIPGATEFGYDTQVVRRVEGAGVYEAENRHVTTADTDFEASLDQLLAACPNLESVALVVAWFGTDLRAGQCQIRPGVDRRSKQTLGPTATVNWRVCGQTRANAHLVSRHDGRPAFAGTPNDDSVRRAIQMLKARGLKVTLYPFVMMDIPADNGRPDPWSGEDSQPAYPWRGRITCHPAPGRPGSPDGTAGAGTQVAALFGSCLPGHFGTAGGQVTYSGPDEWSLRRMALHYARLSTLAGGVEAILIGSEMEALTRVRSASGTYPAANALAALAADVKAVVGAGTKVSYAANWTEYGAHVPGDGSEVRFPLDAVWGAAAVDFVAVDWYPPLADWRDGEVHRDAADHASIHDPAYLAANRRGGEAFDWYYADDAARAAQARSPITDGAHGEPWMFRQKDIAGWWANAHHERVDGVRQPDATDWVPGSKPVRFTETGCAAVDKGANRPSSFPDPKSSETGYPPFSARRRDDLMQRRFLEAMLDGLDDAAFNPAAALPAGRMIAPDAVHAWSWDARPYPAFPVATGVWADGANWETGHWLNGRLGGAPLAGLAATLAADFGVALDAGALRGVVDGYVVDRPMTARAALEPLARTFGFDLAERGDGLVLRPRGGPAAATLTDDDLVRGERPELRLVRGAESELPRAVTLGFVDGSADYRQASAASRRLAGGARAETGAQLALVTSDAVAEAAAEVWLQDLWATRDTASFALPPSRLALEPGDLVRLQRDGRERLLEITAIEDTEARAVTARSVDPGVFDVAVRAARPGSAELPPASGPPAALALALPALWAGEPVPLVHVAAFASPWPGALALWRAVDGASFERVATLAAPALMGTTRSVLPPGLPWRWQRGVALEVEIHGGLIAAASEAAVLGGANAFALVAPDGRLEVLQLAEAELIGVRTWRLDGLLRGQLGTEAACRTPWPEGTVLVRLDANLAEAVAGLDLIGRTATFRVGRADRDHGDIDVTELAAEVVPRALFPLAPVHARARRGGEGVVLSWIRRTRTEGDSWDVVEVPLGEAMEAYRVEILDGAGVRRSYETAAPVLLYPAAAELDDFGTPQAELAVRIAQISATVGAGLPLEATLQVG